MMSPDQPVDANLKTEAGLGTRLRLGREKLGLTTKDVAAQMHLDPRHIEAIEREDFSSVAAPVFVRGYLRSYARLLNLPADPIVQQYESLAGVSPPPLKGCPIGDATPAGEADRSVRWISYAVVVGSVILALVWWLTEGSFKLKQDDAVASLAAQATLQEPHPQQTPVAPPQTPAVPPETAPAADLSPGPAALSTASPGAAVEPAVSPPGSKINTEATHQTPVPPPVESPATDSAASPARGLKLSFSENSWVEITDGAGKRVFYDLAKRGSQQSFQNIAPPLHILLGNAAAVSVDYNGKRFDHSRYNRNNVARFTLE
ncbi:MAG: RodZ domain-containing protein [Gammaproteobacteria bacterium]